MNDVSTCWTTTPSIPHPLFVVLFRTRPESEGKNPTNRLDIITANISIKSFNISRDLIRSMWKITLRDSASACGHLSLAVYGHWLGAVVEGSVGVIRHEQQSNGKINENELVACWKITVPVMPFRTAISRSEIKSGRYHSLFVTVNENLTVLWRVNWVTVVTRSKQRY